MFTFPLLPQFIVLVPVCLWGTKRAAPYYSKLSASRGRSALFLHTRRIRVPRAHCYDCSLLSQGVAIEARARRRCCYPGGWDALHGLGAGLQLFSLLPHTQPSPPKARPLGRGGWVGRVISIRHLPHRPQPSSCEIRAAHQPKSPFTQGALPCHCSLDHPSSPEQVCLTLHLRDQGWDVGASVFREPQGVSPLPAGAGQLLLSATAHTPRERGWHPGGSPLHNQGGTQNRVVVTRGERGCELCKGDPLYGDG